MCSGRLKLNCDKTECILISANSSVQRNVDISSLMLGNISVDLSRNVRNLGVTFDDQLTLNEQINNVKRKVIVNLINISRIAKFVDKDTRMKLVHGLVFSVIDFCNALYYGLPDVMLNGLQMLINSAARIAVGFPRLSRERVTPVCIDFEVLPIKARIKNKICLLAHKGVQCKEPLYLNEKLELREPPTIKLRSNYNTWKLVESIVPGPDFTIRSFKYCAAHLYITL